MAKFEKGQSGNPGGRPKEDNELKKLCKAATPRSYERISDLAEHSLDEAIKLKANTWIVEYAYGKAKESVDHEHSGDIFININRKPKTDGN